MAMEEKGATAEWLIALVVIVIILFLLLITK